MVFERPDGVQLYRPDFEIAAGKRPVVERLTCHRATSAEATVYPEAVSCGATADGKERLAKPCLRHLHTTIVRAEDERVRRQAVTRTWKMPPS